jgi:hypothetical protein
MWRIRLLLSGLLAVLAVSVSAAAQASAAQHYFLVEETEVAPKQSFTFEGTSKASKMEGSVAKVKVVIKCEKDVLSGSLEESGINKSTIEYKECKLFSEKEKEVITGCKVTEPIVAKVKGNIIGAEESETREPVEDKFSAQEGSEFTKIEIVNKEKETCIAAGKYPVTGSQICKLPNGEKEATEHEIECTASGSKLTLAGEKASLTSTESVKLKASKRFAAVEKAAILFNWRVVTKLLLDDEAKPVTSVTLNGKLTFAGTVNTTSFKFECNTLNANAGPEIVGQLNSNFPGYMTIGLKISGCTENITPANCTIPAFETVSMIASLVEGVNGSAGRFLIAFKNVVHAENKLFEIKFEGVGCSLVGTTAVVGRNDALGLLGELSPMEKLVQEIKFEPTQSNEAKYLFGDLFSAGLFVEPATSNRVTVKGTIEMKLVSNEAFKPN